MAGLFTVRNSGETCRLDRAGTLAVMKFSLLIALVFPILFSTRLADADRWDSRGWVKLGERTVDPRGDRDRIQVGRREGKFTKLTLVVEKNDLELLDLEVVFANGERFNPKVRHYFREGGRSRVIDLPGNERMIKTIELTYKGVGRGRARLEVWGWKTDDGGGNRRDRRDRRR